MSKVNYFKFLNIGKKRFKKYEFLVAYSFTQFFFFLNQKITRYQESEHINGFNKM